jgi:hypothetical protein
MSKPTAQQSAFKQLFTEMLNQGGDFSKVSKDLKKPLKTYVKESYPFFLVTDGYFFVQAYFTKEAVAEYKAKFGNVNITDLHDRVVVLNSWSLEIRKVNSAEVFTSYGNLEIRLIVTSFKPNLNERLNPTRYPINLFRDDEIKTQIQHFRHTALQASLSTNVKGDSLPDIAKVSTASKTKVEGGIVKASTAKGDDFSDFTFKEGTTAVVALKDIYVSEHGAAAKPADHAAVPKVKGGKAAAKAASKSAAKTKKVAGKKSTDKTVEKVLKYTPSKSAGKKETPQKGGSSAKKSTTGGKKQTPAMPSPGGKKSTKTTDQMTMAQFKKYLDWHNQKKGKTIGKRSATGKESTASGKAKKVAKK